MYKALILALLFCTTVMGTWPQYHGPLFDKSSNHLLPEPAKLLTTAPLWSAPTPLGFSSFSMGKDSAYTLVAEEDEDGLLREICICLDLKTGKRLWQTKLGRAHYGHAGGNAGASGNSGGDGPRSTPSVNNGKVFVYDSSMTLHCLSAKTGMHIWKIDIVDEYAGANIMWKNASSPLLVNDLVIIIGGGKGKSIIGIHQQSGEMKWSTGNETATHSTPVFTSIHGQKQVIFLCRSGLVSLNPINGKQLWKQAFPFKVSSASSPVVAGNYIFCSAGYGVGAGLFKITKENRIFESKMVWRKQNELMVHWSTPLYYNGKLYGIFGFKKYGKAPLQCIDVMSGKIQWSEEGFGPGNLIRSGNLLLVLSDDGQLVTVDANAEEYRELGRRKFLSGKCWSTPSMSKDILLLRSTVEAKAISLTQH